MLDELDCGVVLWRDGAHVVHMNHAARRGLRRLVTLGTEGARVAVVLTPIGDSIDGSAPLSALVFGRSRLCERISVQWFARAHGLTPAESTVLELLSDGLQPSDIARANAVGMTTVRTQIKGIRDKSCAASIRGPLHQVAMLPAINARPLRPCAGRVPGCGPPARACSTSHCAWACNTCGVGFSQGSDGEWSKRPSSPTLTPAAQRAAAAVQAIVGRAAPAVIAHIGASASYRHGMAALARQASQCQTGVPQRHGPRAHLCMSPKTRAVAVDSLIDALPVPLGRLALRDMAARVGCSRQMLSRVMKDVENGGHVMSTALQLRVRLPLPARW